jgi:peptidyl-prolyl cis-trans isomerase SurA
MMFLRIRRALFLVSVFLPALAAHAQLGLKPPQAPAPKADAPAPPPASLPGAAPADPGAAPSPQAPFAPRPQGFGTPPAAAPAATAMPSGPSSATRSGKRVGLLDRVVAVVNNEVITKGELDARIALVVTQLRAQKVALPPADVVEKQVLERMITDRAQLQFARDSGVKVDDLTLDRTIARIAEQNRMSVPEFRSAIERDNIPFERFREDLRNEIVVSRLREREVDQRIQVSDTEIDVLLDEQKNDTGQSVEFNLRHILVRVPEQASPDQLERQRMRAEEARELAQSGKDFAQLAVAFSDAPDALQGGSLGWRPRDRLPELFTAQLDKMKAGDVSSVLRSPAGFHVLKLEDRRGKSDGAQVVDQVRVRHILMRVSETVSDTEARRKLTLLRERILGGADFAELARLNSDDPSAGRGGELGWVYPGDTVPEFERAMNALKIGEVSEPVRSPFGWHLVEVLERRQADVAPDRQRMAARRVLAERKADESYQEWLRQLRDRTYVEYRLDER